MVRLSLIEYLYHYTNQGLHLHKLRMVPLLGYCLLGEGVYFTDLPPDYLSISLYL